MPFTPQVQKAVIVDNLRAQNRALSEMAEIRLSYIEDAARWVFERITEEMRKGVDYADALRAVSEFTSEEEHFPFAPIEADDIWRFCRSLTGRTTAAGLFDPAAPAAPAAVAFVPRSEARAAFSILSRQGGCRAVEVSDLREACEEVTFGHSDRCLLPESEDGTRLWHITALAHRSRLCLHAFLTVGATTYGLYGLTSPAVTDDPGAHLIEWRLSSATAETRLHALIGRGRLAPEAFYTERTESYVSKYLRAVARDREECLCALTAARLFCPDAELTALAPLSAADGRSRHI